MTRTLKMLTFFLPLVIASSAVANQFNILKCLAQEEERLHKTKNIGPVYELNQLFINTLAATGNIKVKDSVLQKICFSKDFSPSVELMRIYLLEGVDIYDQKSLQGLSQNFAQMTKNTMHQIRDDLPHIFFRFLAKTQYLTGDPHCYQEEIPEAKKLMDRFYYLEENVSVENLLSEKSEMITIFKRLKNFPSIRKKCVARAEKLKKIRGD